ncbi:membrane-spanning 4-domains subfamily A member 14 [Mus pahari]|uniref:membrane-spanning 4-domains subfamily A member 14 n=1 Tax=Mus pahari TaxID=10093 RepID=UPI000A313285|nr:membrane-spanning 4-domains subfamily A member 14 [Mus pahari]
MESPSEEKRRNHVITIDPDETVLTAYPYRPHSSLLDFLKGEPKLLGAIQILLSLVIIGFGIILALNFIFSSKKIPLVILTGYPFWGAVIFFLTGLVTMFHDKPRRILKQDITTMNVLSSLTALAGIALTLLSFTQQHRVCQTPSLEGPCVVGKTLLLGILSVLLIITIVEFSISVTIVSLRNRCWTSPRKAVFFFPSEGAQNTEHPAPEENDTLQFEFQEKSSKDNTASSIKSVFLGGYAFFKLRVSRNSSTPKTIQQKSDKDLQILNTQVQIQQYPEVFYRDIRTEVMELTQEWKSNQGKKPTRRLSLSLPGKRGPFHPKRYSVDLQVKSEKPRRYSEDLQSKTPRRKSIDQQIKAWISPKKTTAEKQDAYTQTADQLPHQQAEDQQAEDQQTEDQQAQDDQAQDEGQQSDKEQPPEEQAQVQPVEDQQPKEQKAPKTQLQNWQGGQQVLVKRAPRQLCDNWETQSFQYTEKSCSFWSTPSWQPISQRSQDWISQGWRNKDWKAQEWQFEVKPSLDWESQELLERESLRQRALYQQIQPQTTIVHQTPDHQLPNFIFQVGLCQGSRQQDSESGVLIEDVYEDDVQSREREPGNTEDTCQKLTDQQSEDMRPDNYPVSCQSLVPYTYVTCLSNIASEQEVQNNTPCSGSSKDLNATSSSSYQRDQQQSEDSD